MTENTKNIPKLTPRESVSFRRLQTYHKSSELLLEFFNRGFRSFPSVKGIVHHFYPDVDPVKLNRVWNMRVITKDTEEMLRDVLTKLNAN